MSYDVYLRSPPCPTCAHVKEFYIDPTYNLAPIFHLALTGEDPPTEDYKLEGAGLCVLKGKRAKDTLITLDEALFALHEEALRPAFEKLKPPMKSCTVADAIAVLTEMRRAAFENPEGVWEIK